ncbi:MAG TPA: oligogalacturonate lyase family protein [Blastocatellia bacterium]|nr:oligogalacturonate lyase family protein [Blastocatellia bacterium]
MRRLAFLMTLFLIPLVGSLRAVVPEEPPLEWIDPATGHRVIRLSREPGSESLYFHQNAYSPDGQKLVIITSKGLSTVNLKTREIEQIVEGRVGVIVTGRKSGEVFYTKRVNNETIIYATHLDNHKTREIGKLPRGSVSSLNADETLLLGVYTEGNLPGGAPRAPDVTPASTSPQQPMIGPDGKPLTFAEQKEVRLNTRLEQRIPMAMFTINTRTAEMKIIHRSTDWLNHLQFSPTDPALIMFCHEGPWHKVDRIWTIHTDGNGLTKIHTRTMNMEIAGHEFFSDDGRIIWYDLQTPRGEDFWLAGYEIATGQRTWYHLQRDEWSVHFNVSRDGSLFAGDGGDDEMVAHAKDGKWIYLFRPEGIPDVAGIKAPNSKDLVKPGFFKSERLVNMGKHNYQLEPNVTFTQDMKWVVFRSNMFGPTHVFAVEIERAGKN